MLITICFLTGCGIAPDAQPNMQQAEKPCKPDTVYVEVGSSAWWGVLPEGEFSTPSDYPITDTTDALWYWHTENDTTVLPARVMRHAWPKTDTLRDTIPAIIFRDSTGRWHELADSLQMKLDLLESARQKSAGLFTWSLLGIFLVCGGLLTWGAIRNINKMKL